MRAEIHTAAINTGQVGNLDQVIYDADMIEVLASKDCEPIQAYWDIPVESLIALRPRDFYPQGSNWRKATLGLICNGWDKHRDEIVDYFTSPLGLKSFPAPNSELELRIGIIGGAYYCKLGQHRAAAAKAWLSYNRPTSAIFQHASCYYRPIRRSLKLLIAECLKNGAILKYFHDPEPSYKTQYTFLSKINVLLLILVEHLDSSCDLYAIFGDHEELVKIRPSNNALPRWLKYDLRSKCLRLAYKVMPIELMQIMLDDQRVLGLIEKTK